MKEHYDLLYFVAPTLNNEEVTKIHQTVQEMITNRGGKISKETIVGKRKLGYKVKQHKYGIYLNVYFEIEPEKIQELETGWRLDNTILRHLAVKGKPRLDLNFKAWSFDETEQTVPMKEGVIQAKQPEKTEKPFVPETAQKTVHVPEQKKTVELTEEAKKDDKKVTLEELDEKLDKILSDEIDT